MDADRLVEPLGLLHGEAARQAVAAGLARWLAGGPAAFALCRLIGDGPARILAVDAVPPEWDSAIRPVCQAPAPALLPPGPLVMGILNVTPDSFSDGGRHADADAAVEAAMRMVGQGAALIDLGGESTRPGAAPVSPDQEQARILPVLHALVGAGVPVSVDTRHAATMRAALAAGAVLVNDVSGLAHDPASAGVVAASGCPVVLMHMRGTPQTMASHATYADVAVEVTRALARRIAVAEGAGIGRDRILIDPGIGFAKGEAQNLALLARLPILAGLGCRLLLGVSRKGFIGRIGGAPCATDRAPGSIAAALPALALPGTVLRVHDVAETVQAVRLWQAVHG